MSYMRVILFVGKSWCGGTSVTLGLLWGWKIGDSAWGWGWGGNRGGRGGKEMWPSAGMWEPLLRFIGVGILWTEALFMVKPLCLSLFIRWDKADRDGSPLQQGQAAPTRGSVTWYTRSTGPTIQHLSPDAHAPRQIDNGAHDCQLRWRGLGLCLPPWNTGCEVWDAPAVLLGERIGVVQAVRTLHASADEYTLARMLTTASRLSLGARSRSHGDNLFIQQFPQNPAILYLGLLYENTGITFNFINGGTLDERCCRKPATSVCCIHFSAGSTYSSCLMMLIRAASFTDKCVFGRIHHPEWVFLMSHRSACFTLSSIR